MPPENSQSTPAKAGSNGQDAAKGAAAATPGSSQVNAIELLKADHRKVEGLFEQFKSADESRKDQIVREICTELVIHSTIEEKVFYPACRQAATDEEPLDEAQVEHDSAKLLIADLMRGDRDDPYRDAKVTVLAEQIKHHVGEEEMPRTGIMARAEAAGVNKPELAQRLQEAKQSLQSRAGRLPTPRPVSFGTANFKEDFMPRQNGGRERDERGRFMDEDERGGRGRGYYSARDDDGRFASRGGGRDYDDDRGSRGRGQGGWFGDREGHSEASRRGWEDRDDDRRYSRSPDDDDGRYSRSRDDDDDRRSGRGHGGWFGASAGHSEASRRGWEDRDDDRRYSRSRDDDDDRRYSRARDDDDDRRSGRGHGGWFGDSRGHAEAAREGWERRR